MSNVQDISNFVNKEAFDVIFVTDDLNADTLTLSNRYSENMNLNLKFCVALCNVM